MLAAAVILGVVGLSPRVRGNRSVIFLVAIVLRSIPACAGEPLQRYCRRGTRGVYPRVCGGITSKRMVDW